MLVKISTDFSAFQRPAAFLYHLSSRIPQTLDGGSVRVKNPKAEALKRTNANTVNANTTISVTFDILQRAACLTSIESRF